MHTNFGNKRLSRRLTLLAGAALMVAGSAGSAHALETTFGDWQVNLDTTLTSSFDVRASSRAHSFIGKANGGTSILTNTDNGNLNFSAGDFVDAPQKITTELQIKKDDYGIFVRAYGFYDPVINSGNIGFATRTDPSAAFPNGQAARIGLSHAAQKDIGADLRLLDAYVFLRPSVFGHPVDVRIGNQVLNWGESTFVQFGINSITPLDVTQLHRTGAELRTAFLPIPAIDLKTDITDDISIEAFWQPYWTRTKLDPVGSFYNSNQDALFDGGTYANLNTAYHDFPGNVNYVDIAANQVFGVALPRRLDRHPTSLAEGGVALRGTVDLFGGTEWGAYFENYNSRTPFGHYRTGSKVTNVSFGLPLPTPLATGYATNNYTATAGYFADYPSDIHLIGASFNLTGPAGIAIQGEISHRLNQPIQYGAADLLLEAFAPAACDLGTTLGIPAAVEVCREAKALPLTAVYGGHTPRYNQDILSYKRFHVTQMQMTMTKLWGAQPDLYLNQLALVGEIGADYVHNFPSQAGIFNAPFTTDTASAFQPFATPNNKGPLSHDGFTSAFSAAYTLRLLADMPDVLPYGIGMKPVLSFEHDFLGTSPVGVNIFQRNTASASLGVDFTYLNQWDVNVGYTNHFPLFDSGKYYSNIDRDFLSMSVSYLF